MKDQDLFVLNKLLPLLYYIAQAGFEFPSAWIIGMEHTPLPAWNISSRMYKPKVDNIKSYRGYKLTVRCEMAWAV